MLVRWGAAVPVAGVRLEAAFEAAFSPKAMSPL